MLCCKICMNSPAIYIYIYISHNSPNMQDIHEFACNIYICCYNPNMADILESPIYIMLHQIDSEPGKLVYFLPEYRSLTRHAYVAGRLHPDSTTRGWDIL